MPLCKTSRVFAGVSLLNASVHSCDPFRLSLHAIVNKAEIIILIYFVHTEAILEERLKLWKLHGGTLGSPCHSTGEMQL